jgi:hypothetical protein
MREHRTVEPASSGVAKRGVIAAKECDAVGEEIFDCVAEREGGTALDDSLLQKMSKVAVPRDLAQADDDTDLRERGNFSSEMLAAVPNLLWGRLIARRGAAHNRADPQLAELEAVIATDCLGLAG